MKPIKTEPFNTNNGWGFGGGQGVQHTYANGVYVRIGRAGYRHSIAQDTGFVCYYNSDGYRLIDIDTIQFRNGTVLCLNGQKLKEAQTFIIETNPSREKFEEYLESLK